LIAAAVAIVGVLVVRRLPSIDAILAALATAIAWFAGAPFAHAHLRHASAFTDTYHRLGSVGVVLFVLLLGTTVWGLPRPFAPGLLAAAAGAVFVPLEATAPLWLLAGFAASSSSPEGPLRLARDEQRLVRRELELEAERQALAEEQRRLRRRRLALDEREAQLAAGAPAPAAVAPPPPRPSAPRAAFDPTGGLFYAYRDLAALRRLVAERGAEFPDRLDEWVIYLETLEPYAENGILPIRFEQVVEDVFGPLLA
jgi:hypothetical protein